MVSCGIFVFKSKEDEGSDLFSSLASTHNDLITSYNIISNIFKLFLWLHCCHSTVNKNK